jgi:hypothetical protein
MVKPIIVRECRKHGMQKFYESKISCMGSSAFQYRCALCKHEYYESNVYEIKQRNKKNSAKNQAAYRKRLKLEAVSAYSTSCACGESDVDALVVICADGSRAPSHAWLKRNGWPSGFSVLCRNCRATMKTSCPA